MSTRPPPPDSRRPPPYSMVSRMYKTNFRPVVVITALLTAGWTLVWGIGAFQDLNVDKQEKETKFAKLDIALGALYMAACALSLSGVVVVMMDKLIWANVYRLCALVAALCVVTTGFVRSVTHFAYKNELINECAEIVQGHDLTFRFGIWGPRVHETLNADEAQQFCKNGWSHDSFSEIVSLLVEIVLMFFFASIAFTYYKQMLDPSFGRKPVPTTSSSSAFAPPDGPPPNFPEHYNPPYLSYDAPAPLYAPPAGPPPGFGGKGYTSKDLDEEEDGKGDDPFADFESTHRNQPAGQQGRVGESREALV